MMNAYCWGLVSGLSSHLLKDKDYESIILADGLDHALSALEPTVYGQYMRGLSNDPSLSDIQSRIQTSYLDAYHEVISSLPEPDRGMADSLMRGVWDLANLKAIMRGARLGVDKDEMEKSLSAYGTMSKEKLLGIYLFDDQTLLREIPPQYRLPMELALAQKDPIMAEKAFERSFLEQMLSTCKGDVRDYVLAEADLLNLRTILMCKMRGVDPRSHIIDKGLSISSHLLEQLVRADLRSFAQFLVNTPYHDAVSRALSDAEDSPVEALDLSLSNVVWKNMETKSFLHPLSVNSTLAYLKRREREVNLLKAILAGKFHNLSKEKIRGLIS